MLQHGSNRYENEVRDARLRVVKQLMKLLKLRVLAWQSVGQPSKSIAPNGASQKRRRSGTAWYKLLYCDIGSWIDNLQSEKAAVVVSFIPQICTAVIFKVLKFRYEVIKTKPTWHRWLSMCVNGHRLVATGVRRHVGSLEN